MVVIIDYGMGNLYSVAKAFRRIHVDVKISSDIDDIAAAEKLILPGVGHFKMAMGNLTHRELIEPLNTAVQVNKTPILGICLGMQFFTKHSEEGDTEGLGWIDAQTVKFRFEDQKKFRVPHIGWNTNTVENQNPLYDAIDDDTSFYFVHSHFVQCNKQGDISMNTEYGQSFTSSLVHENIYATQFHPEKSHDQGLALLKNFIDKT